MSTWNASIRLFRRLPSSLGQLRPAPRLGLAVGSTELRASLAVRGAIVWQAAVPRNPETALDTTIDALLSAMPLAKHSRRPRLVAAIGPAHAHLRCLEGLPASREPRTLGVVVRQSPRRFFESSRELVVSDVRPAGEGLAWAAAFDREVVEAVVSTSRKHRLRCTAIVPAAVLVRGSEPNSKVVWADGALAWITEWRGSELASVRRVPTATIRTSAGDDSAIDSPSNDWHFADTNAAALHTSPIITAFRPTESSTDRELHPSELVAGMACVLICALVTVAVPGIVAMHASKAARFELLRLQPAWGQAVADRREIDSLGAEVEAVSAFAASRRSMVHLLARITSALSESTSLLTLRVDSAGGTLTISSEDPGGALEELETIPELQNVTIVGPVTSELAGQSRRHRATLHFAWARVGAMSRRAPPGADRQ